MGARLVVPSWFSEQINMSGLGEVRFVAWIMFSSFIKLSPRFLCFP